MFLAEERTPLGYYAELEAKRFTRSELHEFLTIWFPRTAAFAVMRGGSVSAAVTQDRAMDVVGTFYVKLPVSEKARWDAWFGDDDTLRVRAMRVGLSKSGLRRWKDELMERLGQEF